MSAGSTARIGPHDCVSKRDAARAAMLYSAPCGLTCLSRTPAGPRPRPPGRRLDTPPGPRPHRARRASRGGRSRPGPAGRGARPTATPCATAPGPPSPRITPGSPGVETAGNIRRGDVRHHALVVAVALSPGGLAHVCVEVNGWAHASSENTLVILATAWWGRKSAKAPKPRKPARHGSCLWKGCRSVVYGRGRKRWGEPGRHSGWGVNAPHPEFFLTQCNCGGFEKKFYVSGRAARDCRSAVTNNQHQALLFARVAA